MPKHTEASVKHVLKYVKIHDHYRLHARIHEIARREKKSFEAQYQANLFIRYFYFLFVHSVIIRSAFNGINDF